MMSSTREPRATCDGHLELTSLLCSTGGNTGETAGTVDGVVTTGTNAILALPANVP